MRAEDILALDRRKSENDFEEVEGCCVMLMRKGHYRASSVYVWNGSVFGVYRKSCIRLLAEGYTSAPDVFWRGIDTHPRIEIGRLQVNWLKEGEAKQEPQT